MSILNNDDVKSQVNTVQVYNEAASPLNSRPGSDNDINTLYANGDMNSYKQRRFDKIYYGTKMSNRIPPTLFHKIKMSVLNEVDKVMAHTLGPFGTFNLIQPNASWNTVAFKCKDGWTSMNNTNFAFDDPIPHSIMFIIQDICNHMNFYVGDGTTTGIPIAKALYTDFYKKFIKKGAKNRISAAGIVSILDSLEKCLKEQCVGFDRKYSEEGKVLDSNYNPTYVKAINRKNVEETMKTLTKVSTVSANNDQEIGQTIASLFDDKLDSAYPFVNLRMGEAAEMKDRIVRNSGFEFNHGYTDGWFANQPGGLAAQYDNPKFALFNGPILETDVQTLEDLVCLVNFGYTNHTWKKIDGIEPSPLVIMAEKFSPQALRWSQDALNGAVYKRYNPTTGEYDVLRAQILFMQLNIQNPADYEIFEDFAVAVGATPQDAINGPTYLAKIQDPILIKDFFNNDLGSADRIQATSIDCRIIGGQGIKDKVLAQIQKIEGEISKHSLSCGMKPDESLLRKWRTRVDMLKADMCTIYVGGANDREKESRITVYDDCVRSVKSSIVEGGVSLGGNLTIPHFIKFNKEKIVDYIVNDLKSGTKNIVIGSKEELMREKISEIVDTVGKGFGTSYKRAIWNVLQDDEEVESLYDGCLDDPNMPKTYNMITGKYESFADFDNCNLIVPANTDKELLTAIFAFLRQMVGSQQMLSAYSLSVNWEEHVRYYVLSGQGVTQ